MKIVCWLFLPLFWHSEKYLQTIKNKTILLEFHLFDELHFNIYTSISNKKIETKSFFLLPIFQEAPSPFHILLSLILSLSGIKLNLHESSVEILMRWRYSQVKENYCTELPSYKGNSLERLASLQSYKGRAPICKKKEENKHEPPRPDW